MYFSTLSVRLSALFCFLVFSFPALAEPKPDIEKLVVYGEKGVTLLRGSVVGGTLGSGGNVHLGAEAEVGTDIFAGKKVLLQENSRVKGNVFTGEGALFQKGAAIEGILSEQYPDIPAVEIPVLPGSPGNEDITIPAGGNRILGPGSYGRVSLGEGSDLALTGGEYFIKQLLLAPNSRLLIAGASTVIAGNGFVLEEGAIIETDANSIDPQDFILTATTVDVEAVLGKKSRFHGKIFIPYGNLFMGNEAYGEGLFLAKKITIGTSVHLDGIFFTCVPVPEVCDDGLDQDCNGADLACVDADRDGDGFSVNHGDCDDTDGLIYPNAPETCDSADNNCNNQIDEGVQTPFYVDADHDEYGDSLQVWYACEKPFGFTVRGGDCDDANPALNPGAPEVCDGDDNNCDGNADEGVADCFQGQPVPPPPSAVAPPLNETQTTPISDAVSFLYTGNDPIQTNVDAQKIEPVRAGVIRGRVLQRNGDPLPGATITVKDHLEYGSTLSRMDGWFDLAVNGGTTLVVHYEKDGYLPADRKVKIEWQEYAFADDVAMITADSAVTAVNLAGLQEIAVARANPVQDVEGTRQATLLFSPGTTATMILANGQQQALTDLHVRATEYTVGPNGPKAMPVVLPANSAYTYAVELSADEAVNAGATRVNFSQPVIFYVENFLNFKAGENVPLGYYDSAKSAWIDSDNGRIIKILSITNGMADLDVTGSGQASSANTLAGLGITDAERTKLAALYQAGISLWRMLIPHFSPWDANWGLFPPVGAAIPPVTIMVPTYAGLLKDGSCQAGSIIGCENQTLGEDVDVTGAPFDLHYQSERQKGRSSANTVLVTASGPNLSPLVRRIDLEFLIAGRKITDSLQALSNQTYTFTWDGKDVYGREIQGAQTLAVRVGYAYQGEYQRVPRFGLSGDGVSVTGDKMRQELVLWQESQRIIGTWDVNAFALGGWGLSIHHIYDPQSRIVYLGNGGRMSGQNINNITTAYAGTGIEGSSGDGGPAAQATLTDPRGLAVDAKGNVYISDAFNTHRIRKVDSKGIITTFAGTSIGFAGDGGPATTAKFNKPSGLAVDREGNLYVADMLNHRIRKIDVNGIITTVAGTGTPFYNGDGILATQAQIRIPTDVDIDKEGNLYIADAGNYRIRKVNADGIISTIAGDGNPPIGDQNRLNSDNVPASGTQICYNGFASPGTTPVGVDVDDDGNIYISESNCGRVRKISPDGLIRIVAGGNLHVYLLDGQNARSGRLGAPLGVAVDAESSLYIAARDECKIRKVSTDGIITTVVGKDPVGQCRSFAEVGAATATSIGYPNAVAMDHFGSYYSIAFSRVIKTNPPFKQFSGDDLLIASEDGSEIYHFDKTGRHLQTLNALTYQPIYTFGYDPDGLLVSVTDGDSKATTITRQGDTVAIASPFGQVTNLKLDPDSYLESAVNPNQEKTSFTYKTGGLLETLTNPRTFAKTYDYDNLGRLKSSSDAFGGGKTLTRTGNDANYNVSLATVLNRTTVYHVDYSADGTTHREVTDPAGFKTITHAGTNASKKITSPDGTVTLTQLHSDPRFGMQAPLADTTVTLPSTLASVTTLARSVTLADPLDLSTLQTQTDTLKVNNRTYTQVYTAANKEFVNTSPQNRLAKMVIDGQGRVTKSTVTGIDSVNYHYDAQGRLDGISQGNNLRPYTLAYEPSGFLDTITDPANRVVSFDYDNVGRVKKQVLPDLREINYTYDSAGNLKTVTPPSRPAHTFVYNAVDLAEEYAPPNVGLLQPQTFYDYNFDHQLELITRPDGKTVDFVYGPATGRLDKITVSRGDYVYTYDPAKGTLSTITNPEGDALSYTYDGFLLKTATWAGAVAGSVTRNYDANFRVISFSVNGANAIAMGYDNDNLLTSVDGETITRRADNGLIDATTLGVVTTDPGYNNFGELSTDNAKANGNTIYDVTLLRDDLGRIYDKTETIGGPANHYVYGYDTAGRLETVTLNGANPTTYGYDDNGNRTTVNGQVVGTADDQDRLLSYGNNTYTYNDNGDLESKTNGQGQTTYNYDELGNLLSVSLPNGDNIEYIIDGQNRRIGKKVNGVLVQGFLYQDQLRPIAELDGNGAVVSRFVYGTKGNVPGFFIKGGVTYRIVSDHLGSPRLIVNTANGNVAQRLDFDEWGNVTQDTAPDFMPFGFAGGIYDQHTKLVRFGARDYDAETGRWISKDPILFAGGDTNLYGYVLNDPLDKIDTNGKGLISAAICFGIEAIGAIKAGLSYNEIADLIIDYNQRLKKLEAERKACKDQRRELEIEVEMSQLRQQVLQYGAEQSKIIAASAVLGIPITAICSAAAAAVLP